ncbi:MAG: hypothetical protein Q9211_004052, partial [Gyalolechia sp. 1 TL-2023]
PVKLRGGSPLDDLLDTSRYPSNRPSSSHYVRETSASHEARRLMGAGVDKVTVTTDTENHCLPFLVE